MDAITFTFQDLLYKNLTEIARTVNVTFKNLHDKIHFFDLFNFCEYFQFYIFLITGICVLFLIFWLFNSKPQKSLTDTQRLDFLASTLMVDKKGNN